jgi:hypothetical protein
MQPKCPGARSAPTTADTSRTPRLLALLLLSAALFTGGISSAGCRRGTREPAIQISHAPDTDFRAYRTFAFGTARLYRPPDPLANVSTVPNAPPPVTEEEAAALVARVRRALTTTLGARGLTPAASGRAPDLLVNFVAGARTRQQIREGSDDTTARPDTTTGDWWSPASENWFRSRDVRQGSIVLDFIDAKTKRPVWRAFVSAEVGDEKQITDEMLQKLADRVLKDYPPSPKS